MPPGVPTTSCSSPGEVGVGGGLIVDGMPAHRRRGLRRRGRAHPGQPERPVLPLRLGRLLGDRGRRRCALLRRAGHPAGPAAGARSTPSCARRRPGSPVALAALDEVGRWLGFGLAGLVNIFNPRLIVLGGLLGRIHPFVDDGRRGGARPARRCGPRAGSCGSSRPALGDRRPAARRRRARVRAAPRRPGDCWLARASARADRAARAPDVHRSVSACQRDPPGGRSRPESTIVANPIGGRYGVLA